MLQRPQHGLASLQMRRDPGERSDLARVGEGSAIEEAAFCASVERVRAAELEAEPNEIEEVKLARHLKECKLRRGDVQSVSDAVERTRRGWRGEHVVNEPFGASGKRCGAGVPLQA